MRGASVVIVDAGIGNLRSVQKAFESLGARAPISGDPEAVLRADRVIVPGQGAFRDGMKGLGAGLGEAIVEKIRRGTPYLGICLGLQLLFESSEEGGACAGLGVLRGRVRKLPISPPLKVPHMGWNEVALGGRSAAHFYFAHSYYAELGDTGDGWGTCDHGVTFCAAVRRGSLWAVQFHPEKSQRAGLALLGDFLCS
ncbi:MAG: imidazole glycerol phosphate synthase subunit HisH [Myxococcota bacterium]